MWVLNVLLCDLLLIEVMFLFIRFRILTCTYFIVFCGVRVLFFDCMILCDLFFFF